GLSLVPLNGHFEFAFGKASLLLCKCFCLPKLTLLCSGFLLLRIGLHLLFGNLACAKLLQDDVDLFVVGWRLWRADENFFELKVVMCKLLLHLFRSLLLNLASLLNQFDERSSLSNIFEIGGNHWVKGLLHQTFHIAKTLNHERGFSIINVHHHGEGE